MKRFLSVILLVTVILTSFAVPASAIETDEINFTYELNEDGKSYTLVKAPLITRHTVVIPSTYNGLPVTAIGKNAFEFRSGNITVIVISEGITEIGMRAFPELKKLKSIILPLSLRKIDEYAFYGTQNIEYIYYTGSKEQWDEIDISEISYLDVNNQGAIFTPTPDCHVIDDVVISTASREGAGLTLKQCMVCGEIFDEIVSPQLLPNQPYDFSVRNDYRGVNLNYYTDIGDDYLYIYRRTEGTPWKRIAKVEGRYKCECLMECFCEDKSDRYLLDADVKTGTTYYYTIKAENEMGFSTYDKTGVKITYVEAPQLTKLSNEAEGVRISWKSVKGVDGYYIYREDRTNYKTTKIATIKKPSTQSYFDTTVKSGGKYIYSIKAYYGESLSAHDYIYTEHIAAPKITSVKNEKDGIRVDWNKVKVADKYIVYRKTANTGWTRLGVTKDFSFIDSTAKNNTTYYYTVKGQRTDYFTGKTYYGVYDKTGLKIKRLSVPELTKITNEADGVRVYWSKVTGADGYYLYRRVTGIKDWTRIATIKKGSTVSYKDTKAAAGKTYDYIIRAYSGNVTSAPAEKVIRTMRLTVPSLASVSNGNDGVTLKWKKVAGSDSYIIYRKTYDAKIQKWSGWVRIGDGITTTSYIDKTANSGTTYKYTVKACYGSYTSYYNTSGLEVIRLETPGLSSATSTKSGVKLEWDKITGASGYKIYRKTANSGWGEAIATVKGNSTVTYLDKTAKKGVTYTYTVRAYNGNTKSGYIASGKTVTDKY